MQRTVAAVCLILSTMLMVVGLTSSPANADPSVRDRHIDYARTTSSSPPGDHCQKIKDRTSVIGKVCFQAYGDKFWLRDYKADGLAIRMIGNVGVNTTYGCKASTGAKAKWQYCKFSTRMPEDRPIAYFGAATKNGEVEHSTRYHYTYT